MVVNRMFPLIYVFVILMTSHSEGRARNEKLRGQSCKQSS